MLRTLRALWADDRGAVVSIELILIIGIVVFGIIPGLIALRNSTITVLVTLANFANAVSATFSTNPPASPPVQPSQVVVQQLTPVVVDLNVVSPAP